MAKLNDKAEAAFKKYIEEREILVVDPAGAARSGIIRTMTDMGAKSGLITTAATHEAALGEIERIKPQVIITEYNLDQGKSGLDLMQHLRKENADMSRSLFVLVTANTSQSAVAQAAEEDVDTFILKPYTIEIFRQSIMRAALAKVHPSEYQKIIDEGKELLFGGKIDESLALFNKAKGMNPKPALACFYIGQADLMKKLMDEANGSYKEGLNHNKIHYKCLVGLFEILMQQKMYPEAYDIIKRVSRYFPANPQRLGSVLRLAIMTKSYEDIERYYQTFISLEAREDQLVKFICAALVVTGKFYLKTNNKKRAMELFEKAAGTAAGRVKILREIVVAMHEASLRNELIEMVKRFPADTHTGEEYIVSQLCVSDLTEGPQKIVERGREVIKKGIHDPVGYAILIKRNMHAGLDDAAEQLLQEGIKRWPDQKRMLERAKEGPDDAAAA